MSASSAKASGVYEWKWFTKGLNGLFTIPALILMSAFVGFAGLARDLGISFAHTVFMVPVIWALPSHLLVISGMAAGTGLVATAIAVALASIRMMPMTMALMPQLRTEGTRVWHLLLVSNFVAITAWVFTRRHIGDIPRAGRLPFFTGVGFALITAVTLLTAFIHYFAASLPPIVMAVLTFMTPLYFSASIYASAHFKSEKLAMALGIVLAPFFAFIMPDASVLLAGLVGGFAAYTVRAVSLYRLKRG